MTAAEAPTAGAGAAEIDMRHSEMGCRVLAGLICFLVAGVLALFRAALELTFSWWWPGGFALAGAVFLIGFSAVELIADILGSIGD